jgi:hypothetical protein
MARTPARCDGLCRVPRRCDLSPAGQGRRAIGLRTSREEPGSTAKNTGAATRFPLVAASATQAHAHPKDPLARPLTLASGSNHLVARGCAGSRSVPLFRPLGKPVTNLSCGLGTITHNGCCWNDPQAKWDLVQQSASQHDQISRSFRRIRHSGMMALPGFAPKVGSRRDRRIGKGRSACSPIRSSELRQTNLAELRYRVFAKQQFRGKSCGSSSRDHPSLAETFGDNSLEIPCQIPLSKMMFKSTAFIAAQSVTQSVKRFP